MVMTDEERKAQKKAYYEANKDKIAAKRKANREANKEKIKEEKRLAYIRDKEKITERKKKYNKENRERIREQSKAYYKTDAGIKSKRMSHWREKGINNVNSELYDYFMNCDKCEACGCEFTEKKIKCLDHNHDTGDFRYVLCNKCNVHDNWKKIILNHTDN